MRILVLNHSWFPDDIGGLERVARDASVALAARGHQVAVIAPQVIGKPRRELTEGVDLQRLFRRHRFVPRTYTDPVMFRRLLSTLDPTQFDVVLAHNPSNAAAATSLQLPLVYVFHASGLREAQHRRARGVGPWEGARSLMVEPKLRSLEAQAARAATRIVVLSKFSRALLVRDHPVATGKTLLAHGGVDVDRWHPAMRPEELRGKHGARQDKPLLFAARRLVARTGVGLLLEAHSRFRRSGVDAHLWIAGDGEDRAALERSAEELGALGAVRFLGRVSDQTLLECYQMADASVVPTIAYEGFGMATVEALACGVPVASTPVGASPEILRPLNPAWISDDATPTALAKSIAQALGADADARRRCRTHAVNNYAWTKSAEHWERALDVAVATGRGRLPRGQRAAETSSSSSPLDASSTHN